MLRVIEYFAKSKSLKVTQTQSKWHSWQGRKSLFRCNYGVFQKKVAPKMFWNIFTLLKPFCVKYCRFVGNSYPHISTNFCRFILIFHQTALIFLVCLFTQKMKMQLFGNDFIFSSSRVWFTVNSYPRSTSTKSTRTHCQVVLKVNSYPSTIKCTKYMKKCALNYTIWYDSMYLTFSKKL